jgi:hypothetical protein
MIEINSRIHGASPAWLRWALRALKTQMPHPGYWDEATAHRDLMSPANRAGIDTLIRLVPDPVVVASMGPLPSATLHETAVSFRHQCLNTFNDRTHGNRCQEINFRELPDPAAIWMFSLATLRIGAKVLWYNEALPGSDFYPCGSGGTGRHTICPYRFSNSLQASDNKPSTFRLNHFR